MEDFDETWERSKKDAEKIRERVEKESKEQWTTEVVPNTQGNGAVKETPGLDWSDAK